MLDVPSDDEEDDQGGDTDVDNEDGDDPDVGSDGENGEGRFANQDILEDVDGLLVGGDDDLPLIHEPEVEIVVENDVPGVHDDPDEEGDEGILNLCRVCLVSPMERIALIPCGHGQFCENCINRIIRERPICPICCQPIERSLPLFI